MASDTPEILELIAADALACLPRPGPGELSAALALVEPRPGERIVQRSVVAIAAGSVAGTASWLDRRNDGERSLLWLHSRERPEVAAALVAAATGGGSRALRAFTLPTPLQPTPAGLPVEHRPVTRAALLAAGFQGWESWLLLAGEPPDAATRIADVRAPVPGEQWQLFVSAADQRVAEMRVRLHADRVGEVQWIGVAPGCRGRGLGRRLFAQGLHLLGEAGARTVFLAVDAGNPAREHALRMYGSAGFRVLDHLWSYRMEGPTRRFVTRARSPGDRPAPGIRAAADPAPRPDRSPRRP